MFIRNPLLLRVVRTAVEAGASTVFFKPPNRPSMRVGGRLEPVDLGRLVPEDTENLARDLLDLSAASEVTLDTDREISFGVRRLGRFRAILYRQRGTIGIVIHRMKLDIPTVFDLGVPPRVVDGLSEPGLQILTGSGRAPALAALMGAYNLTQEGHVVIFESPVTHLHKDRRARISHREVGIDVDSFAHGLEQAARMGADLIAVGDLPDAEATEAAMVLVERGYAVVAAVPGESEADALTWIRRRWRHTEVGLVEAFFERHLKSTLVVEETVVDRILRERIAG